MVLLYSIVYVGIYSTEKSGHVCESCGEAATADRRLPSSVLQLELELQRVPK